MHFPGHKTTLERNSHGGTPWNGKDYASQGSGHGMQDYLLQRLLQYPHIQVQRGVGETGQTLIRNGKYRQIYLKITVA